VSNSLLTELNALLHATDLLLACADPDSEQLESYGQCRQEIFSRLQNTGEQGLQKENTSLREILLRLQEQDQRLLLQLDRHRSRCREELLTITRARQTVKDRVPSVMGRLLERHI
jgi:hypothetical protein